MSRTPLAVAGAAPLAFVDEHGYVTFDDGFRIEWWVLGDDYWHVPAASPSVRQRFVDNTPVSETAIRVPGGDVVWRVGAAVATNGATIVAECENHASIPVAVGVALVSPDNEVTLAVHPVTHTSTWRGSLRDDTSSALPDLATVARGWLALARQGAQIETGDPATGDALTAARCNLLLKQGGLVALGKRARSEGAGAVADALTLLGYDDEAGSLRLSARLRPSRKGLPLVTWPEMKRDPDAFNVDAIRSSVVDDDHGGIDCLPGFDATWIGRSVDVRDLPTAAGALSFTIRWHGERPAILWQLDAAKRVRLRATAIDPQWETDEPKGEALLNAPTGPG